MSRTRQTEAVYAEYRRAAEFHARALEGLVSLWHRGAAIVLTWALLELLAVPVRISRWDYAALTLGLLTALGYLAYPRYAYDHVRPNDMTRDHADILAGGAERVYAQWASDAYHAAWMQMQANRREAYRVVALAVVLAVSLLVQMYG